MTSAADLASACAFLDERGLYVLEDGPTLASRLIATARALGWTPVAPPAPAPLPPDGWAEELAKEHERKAAQFRAFAKDWRNRGPTYASLAAAYVSYADEKDALATAHDRAARAIREAGVSALPIDRVSLRRAVRVGMWRAIGLSLDEHGATTDATIDAWLHEKGIASRAPDASSVVGEIAAYLRERARGLASSFGMHERASALNEAADRIEQRWGRR